MSSHHSTIQKARKILSSYDEIEPRKFCVQPHAESHSKSKRSSVSASRSSTKQLRKDFSFCGSKDAASPSPAAKRQPSSPSFTSLYARQTRYDRIMQLKVKPAFRESARADRAKQSVLDCSSSSIESAEKENKQRNQSRLDKIMQLKVAKPKVASTLTNYHPKQAPRALPQQRKESAAREWRQSVERMRRGKEQEEREDRLWRVFEREREIRCKLKRSAEQREAKQQRRRQQRFESMVGKEVTKIEREREVAKRKSEGFTNYIYPFF